MKKSIFLSTATAALGALLLTGCLADEREDEDVQLRVTTAMEAVAEASTRGVTDSNNQNDAFLSGKLVDVFIFENATNPTTTYTQPLKAKTGSSGVMTFRDTGDTTNNPQYWPTSGNGVNIYAWYPAGKVSNVTDTGSLIFDVQTNQSSDDNYQASDLMFGLPTSNPVARTTVAVPLTFKHLLSKVTVKLTAGDGMTTAKLDGAVVTIPSVNTRCTITAAGRKTGALSSTTSTSATITLGTTTSSSHNCYAVVPPQAMTNKVITIKLADSNGSTNYTYKISNTTFAGGSEYIYNMQVTATSLVVTSSVTAWTAGGTVTANAIIQ